jgi:hypothetical protein
VSCFFDSLHPLVSLWIHRSLHEGKKKPMNESVSSVC